MAVVDTTTRRWALLALVAFAVPATGTYVLASRADPPTAAVGKRVPVQAPPGFVDLDPPPTVPPLRPPDLGFPDGRPANLGEEVVTVPDVVEMQRDAATLVLEQAGFLPEVHLVEVAPDDPKLGRVIAQGPGAGREVLFGARVAITVGTTS